MKNKKSESFLNIIINKIYYIMLKYLLEKEDTNTKVDWVLHIRTDFTDEAIVPKTFLGYDERLNEYRNKIDKIDPDIWKKVRWYINEYDFLVKDPIINRAFYKYWEIVNEFYIFDSYEEHEIVLHCAEAPGGFIQGTNIYLQLENGIYDKENVQQKKKQTIVDEDGFTTIVKKQRQQKEYKIYTISLNKDLPQYKSYNLPSYNKNIIHDKIYVTYGKDQTGNINNLENVDHIQKIAKKQFYLITADGGFDEGTDFNNKEQLHYLLILSEIYSALKLQKQDGHFILKVFDILTETSLHLLYLLYLFYDEVYIYKPKTSRPTNSEKYIICKHFNRNNIDIESTILNKIKNLINSIKNSKYKYSSFTLFLSIPEHFTNQIKSINSNLLSSQCDFLYEAIQLCEDTNFVNEYELKLDSCIQRRKEIFHEWEKEYNLNAYI